MAKRNQYSYSPVWRKASRFEVYNWLGKPSHAAPISFLRALYKCFITTRTFLGISRVRYVIRPCLFVLVGHYSGCTILLSQD